MRTKRLRAALSFRTRHRETSSAGACLRLDPATGRFRPYGDLIGGFRHLVTRSVVSSVDLDTAVEKDRNLVPCYGWALGLMVGLSESVYAEARVERLITGQVDYVDPASIAIGIDGTVTYEKLSSNVDVLNIQLGIGFRF